MTPNKECCSLCVGAYKDSDLDKGICRNNACECHAQESDWEKKFDKIDKKHGFEDDNGYGEWAIDTYAIKSFIPSLLTSERKKVLTEVQGVIEGMIIHGGANEKLR